MNGCIVVSQIHELGATLEVEDKGNSIVRWASLKKACGGSFSIDNFLNCIWAFKVLTQSII